MSADTSIRRFIRYATLGGVAPRARVIVPDARNVIFRMDEVSNRLGTRETTPTFYSYGTHFPLARLIPAKRGRSALWVINGDVWGRRGWSSTNDHQDSTRRHIAEVIADAAKLGKTVRQVIIPMSALDGAGVDYTSIRPHEVRDDWRETLTHTVWIPRGLLAVTLPEREDAERLARASDPHGKAITARQTLAASVTLRAERVTENGTRDAWQVSGELSRSVTYVGYDYSGNGGRFVDYQDRDGYPQVSTWIRGSHELDIYMDDTKDVDGIECVRATFTSTVHHLGDSLFSAYVTRERRVTNEDGHTDWKTTRKRYRFVSSFDYNEPRPLYFLAALPAWSRAETVDAAIQDLAPASVHAARAAGLDVIRQGDIFAVPAKITTAELDALGATRARLTMWTRQAMPKRGELGYVPAPTAAQWQAFNAARRELVRAAMRANMARDTRPSTDANYRGRRRELVRSIAHAHTMPVPSWYSTPEAIAGFRAGVVKRAEGDLAAFDKRGRASERARGYASTEPSSRKYGKCYRRALSAWDTATYTERAKLIPPRDGDAIRAALAVYGTGHTATHVATLPGGATYVRGTMRHAPEIAGERRASDHRPVKLGNGETWHLAIRNTVPRQ